MGRWLTPLKGIYCPIISRIHRHGASDSTWFFITTRCLRNYHQRLLSNNFEWKNSAPSPISMNSFIFSRCLSAFWREFIGDGVHCVAGTCENWKCHHLLKNIDGLIFWNRLLLLVWMLVQWWTIPWMIVGDFLICYRCWNVSETEAGVVQHRRERSCEIWPMETWLSFWLFRVFFCVCCVVGCVEEVIDWDEETQLHWTGHGDQSNETSHTSATRIVGCLTEKWSSSCSQFNATRNQQKWNLPFFFRCDRSFFFPFFL